MNQLRVGVLGVVIAAGVCGAATDPADAHPDLHLIPWPKTLQAGAGTMPLTADSCIIVQAERSVGASGRPESPCRPADAAPARRNGLMGGLSTVFGTDYRMG
jgi:hypothetical protein